MKTDGKIGFLLKQINDSLSKKANNDLRESGLTLMQVSLLAALSRKKGGEMTLKEIERYFSLSQPTVAGLVSRMEEKGIVGTAADASDRRVKIVHLTKRGEEYVSSALESIDRADETLVDGFSDGEILTLISMLERVKENIG